MFAEEARAEAVDIGGAINGRDHRTGSPSVQARSGRQDVPSDVEEDRQTGRREDRPGPRVHTTPQGADAGVVHEGVPPVRKSTGVQERGAPEGHHGAPGRLDRIPSHPRRDSRLRHPPPTVNTPEESGRGFWRAKPQVVYPRQREKEPIKERQRKVFFQIGGTPVEDKPRLDLARIRGSVSASCACP